MQDTKTLDDKQVVLLEHARKAATACMASLYPNTTFDFNYELGMDYVKVAAISATYNNLCLTLEWYFDRS